MLPATVTTPAIAASNPKLTNGGRLRFRKMTFAALAAYPLDIGEPGFATDIPAIMVGSAQGNVLFSAIDAAAISSLVQQVSTLTQQVSIQTQQLSLLEEKIMSYVPANPVAPVPVSITSTQTLVRPAVPTAYEVDTTTGAVSLTLYPSTGSDIPITIDNVKGTASVTVLAGTTAGTADTFDTPPPVIAPGASNTFRDYAPAKWVVN